PGQVLIEVDDVRLARVVRQWQTSNRLVAQLHGGAPGFGKHGGNNKLLPSASPCPFVNKSDIRCGTAMARKQALWRFPIAYEPMCPPCVFHQRRESARTRRRASADRPLGALAVTASGFQCRQRSLEIRDPKCNLQPTACALGLKPSELP